MAVEVLVSLLQCVLMHPRQSDGEAASDALEVLLRMLLDGTRHEWTINRKNSPCFSTVRDMSGLNTAEDAGWSRHATILLNDE